MASYLSQSKYFLRIFFVPKPTHVGNMGWGLSSSRCMREREGIKNIIIQWGQTLETQVASETVGGRQWTGQNQKHGLQLDYST